MKKDRNLKYMFYIDDHPKAVLTVYSLLVFDLR